MVASAAVILSIRPTSSKAKIKKYGVLTVSLMLHPQFE